MRKLKILIITNYYPPEIGSASHLVYELSESLSKRGHEVVVLTSFPHYNINPSSLPRKYRKKFFLVEEMKGSRVIRARCFRFPRKILFLRALNEIIKAFTLFFVALSIRKREIVFTYSPPLIFGVVAIFVSKLKKSKAVVNIQDLFPQAAVDLGVLANPTLIKVFEAMERYVYKNAQLITVHSDGNKKFILEKVKRKAHLEVIPNWIDTDFIKPGERNNSFRKENDIGDKFVVSFAGVMGLSQDLDTVIEVAKELEEYKDMTFLLVGEGIEKERLIKKCKELDTRNVKFLPMQPREKYPSLLQASDVCLVTLKKQVKTPVVPSKIVSIMAAGRPIAASLNLRGDAAQLIKEAGCGLCVEAEDKEALKEAIIKLYREKELREKMGENGRNYAVRYFSRGVCVEKYESIFLRFF